MTMHDVVDEIMKQTSELVRTTCKYPTIVFISNNIWRDIIADKEVFHYCSPSFREDKADKLCGLVVYRVVENNLIKATI